MTTNTINPSSLSDADLLSTTRLAAGHERNATARLVALLAEVDTRRLFLGEGYSSMFAWCMRALHMSEHAAYARIEAARVARRVPGILERLTDGRMSLTTVGLLAPHLTDENCETLLEAAERKSKREVEHLIASIQPQPDIPASVRALPNRAPVAAANLELTYARGGESRGGPRAGDCDLPGQRGGGTRSRDSGLPRPAVAPLAPRRYLLRVTIGEDTHRKLETSARPVEARGAGRRSGRAHRSGADTPRCPRRAHEVRGDDPRAPGLEEHIAGQAAIETDSRCSPANCLGPRSRSVRVQRPRWPMW